MGLTDIKSMTEEQLEQALQPMGLPAFRSRQIRGWLEKGVGSFEEMTNLPLSVREALKIFAFQA